MFTLDQTFRTTNDIITVREQTGEISRRIRLDIENMPDVFSR